MFEINSENSKSVGMYEWRIAKSNSKISILQTHDINTCVGLSFYNNQTKQAALSHFAVTRDYSDAKKMINMIIKVLIFDNLDTKLDVNIVHNKKMTRFLMIYIIFFRK